MDAERIAAEVPVSETRPPGLAGNLIRARCPRFACRLCRTKTGWPHQRWCELSFLTQPECTDCRYWSEKKHACDHPAARRERGRA